MVKIELSEQEARLLQMLVDSRLSTMTIEIAHTDTREFKEWLRQQFALLEGIQRRLQPAPASTD